ncbi:MAG: flippase-like domain-containing protein [Candidatus Bathyarchaeota archaeon]|nr:flippase-like domain-containing protein [Candidatus Bathyarchaeota archaeon]
MVAIFAALLWYVGVDSLYDALLNIKVEYLVLAALCYVGINVLFAFRLQRVLGKEGIKTSFGKTLLAQFAGMLTSDVTPGRSGYILTPFYLSDQKIPTSKSLSAILGIQTIEFLVKVAGGTGAIIFLISTVPAQNWADFGEFAGINIGILVAVLGVALMLTGAVVLAAFTWSKRAISVFDRILNWRFIRRFTGKIREKLVEYKDSSHKTRKAIPEIALITAVCWVLKGFEWYFLALALGITQIPWLGFFLIHPLVTALAFVPITPAGAGVQEFGIVGIFTLLFTNPTAEQIGAIGAFAVLARGILIIMDLVGIPQIAKTTSKITLFKTKPATTIEDNTKTS